MQVLELMKAHVVRIHPEATVMDAVDRMDLYQVSGLPVVDSNDSLIGVLTEHDVIAALLQPFASGIDSDESRAFEGLISKVKVHLVRDVMSAPAISVDEHASVRDAAATMVERRVKRLPVTANGKLVGIISRIDICQALLENAAPLTHSDRHAPRD